MNNLQLSNPLAFFDLETTGINPVQDRIVEIAVVKLMPNGERHTFIKKVNPEMPIPAECSAIHGIFDADVEHELPFKSIAHGLKNFLEKCDLGGYNSNRFDIPVLVEEFHRAGIDINLRSRKTVDVQQIFFKKEQRTLSAAMEFYCQRPLENAHSAEADVLATIDVLEAQLNKYEDLEKSVPGLHIFTAGEDFIDYARRLVLKDGQVVFNFGKNKGRVVRDVFKKEPQYYDWMMNADFSRDTKQCISEILNELLLPQHKSK